MVGRRSILNDSTPRIRTVRDCCNVPVGCVMRTSWASFAARGAAALTRMVVTDTSRYWSVHTSILCLLSSQSTESSPGRGRTSVSTAHRTIGARQNFPEIGRRISTLTCAWWGHLPDCIESACISSSFGSGWESVGSWTSHSLGYDTDVRAVLIFLTISLEISLRCPSPSPSPFPLGCSKSALAICTKKPGEQQQQHTVVPSRFNARSHVGLSASGSSVRTHTTTNSTQRGSGTRSNMPETPRGD
ncbi:hypothetical protein BO86DRAFT_229211 [Aspergillus japonicus CBS 114.51]|uniref:Uncharacterized protein n=1 Tax=Aspergillus japonicus CBS 114.51 TaxID=1448312 RepID=A0A8T8X9H1_ASPJA|nr:hypothetical protein BO86DRAFT_229211 [Aspergillus japonicus CBS 114.51]RAH84721.1 hypothetical protein BO86DRAFT_229211 [Aspergillus japonicus CBS 114.51]